MPQRHETLPEIPHDAAFICSPADVPGPHKVQLQDKDITTEKLSPKTMRTSAELSLLRWTLTQETLNLPYTLPLKHYEWVQREIESLECASVITKSMSKWASPIVIVPTKSAPGEPPKRRLCVDFRKVNELQQEFITAGKTKGQISIHPLP